MGHPSRDPVVDRPDHLAITIGTLRLSVLLIEDPANGVTNIKGAVLLGLWDAFKEHRIEMPFPQRDVRIRELPPTAALYRVPE